MSAIKLSSRYAKALLDLAIEQKSLDVVLKDMEMFEAAIAASADLRMVLKSPIITGDKKIKLLEKVFTSNISDLTLKFIRVMVNKGREPYLVDIAESFITLYNRQMGITPVKITSAVELGQEQLDKLVAKVKKEVGLETVQLSTAVDPELIGGFVLQFGDKMLDTSVANDLVNLKKQFDNKEYIKQF